MLALASTNRTFWNVYKQNIKYIAQSLARKDPLWTYLPAAMYLANIDPKWYPEDTRDFCDKMDIINALDHLKAKDPAALSGEELIRIYHEHYIVKYLSDYCDYEDFSPWFPIGTYFINGRFRSGQRPIVIRDYKYSTLETMYSYAID